MSLLDGLRKGPGHQSVAPGAGTRRRLKPVSSDHLAADRLAAALDSLPQSPPSDAASDKQVWVPKRASGLEALQLRLRAGAPGPPTPAVSPFVASPPAASPPVVSPPMDWPPAVSSPQDSAPVVSPPGFREVRPTPVVSFPVVSLPLLSPPVRALPVPSPRAFPDNGRHRGTAEQFEDWDPQVTSAVRPPRHAREPENAFGQTVPRSAHEVPLPLVMVPVPAEGGRHRRPAPPKRRILTVVAALREADATSRRLVVAGVLVLLVTFGVVFGLHLASVRSAGQHQPVAAAAYDHPTTSVSVGSSPSDASDRGVFG